MSATQAPTSISPTSEQSPIQPNKPVNQSNTPNHTSGPSTAPDTLPSPSADSSIDRRKQNGSIASSRQSAKAEPRSSENVKSTTAANQTSERPRKKKQKGGKSGFLSFLNCCGGSRDGDDIDLEEHAIPTQGQNRIPASQSVPVKAQDVSAPESSTAESKDLSGEKIGGPPYSDLKSAGEPKTQEQTAGTSGSPSYRPSHPSKPGEGREADGTKLGESVVAIQPATGDAHPDSRPSPATGGDASASVPVEGESVINDRTPQQARVDTDIEMTDAPPVEPLAVEESRSAQEAESDRTPPLPPPPPITPQRQDTSPRQPETSASGRGLASSEQQKWLLPPVKPEHRGRKCLILDLDETLVHSSFKVRQKGLGKFSRILALTYSDFAPSRFHHSGRD